MTFPWEKKPDLAEYMHFMDAHIRVNVLIDGRLYGSFAVVDNGMLTDASTVLPDGASLVLKCGGHPRTIDPVMEAEELIKRILTTYNQ